MPSVSRVQVSFWVVTTLSQAEDAHVGVVIGRERFPVSSHVPEKPEQEVQLPFITLPQDAPSVPRMQPLDSLEVERVQDPL